MPIIESQAVLKYNQFNYNILQNKNFSKSTIYIFSYLSKNAKLQKKMSPFWVKNNQSRLKFLIFKNKQPTDNQQDKQNQFSFK